MLQTEDSIHVRNFAIQRLRAVAALAVVIDHSFQILVSRSGLLQNIAIIIGSIGVYVFFVISGYMMISISYEKFGKQKNSLVFMKNRIKRIFPLYFMITMLVFFVPALSPTADMSLYNLILSLLFVPVAAHPTISGFYPVLSVGWTLNFEIMFYFIFSITLLLKRSLGLFVIFTVLGAVSFFSIAGHWFGMDISNNSRLSFYISPMCIYFLIGISLFLLENKFKYSGFVTKPIRISCLFLFILAVFGNFVSGIKFFIASVVCCGICILFCILNKEKSKSEIGELLGNASYSIYIIHAPILWIYSAIMPNEKLLTGILAIILSMFSIIISGIYFHRFIESPISRRLSKHGKLKMCSISVIYR